MNESLPGTQDATEDFARIHEFLHAGGDRAGALHRLVTLAVAVVPGCDWAAITAWPHGGRPRSLAHTDEIALVADHAQYVLGSGPSLSAASDDESAYIADVDDNGRWPEFRGAVRRRTPVRALLSLRLNEDPARTALSFYSGRPGAYDRPAIAAAALFAIHARVLLMHADSRARAAELDRALVTSRQIGTAMGILMQVHKITAEDAFALLRTASQHLNRKLAVIAGDVNRTGELPR